MICATYSDLTSVHDQDPVVRDDSTQAVCVDERLVRLQSRHGRTKKLASYAEERPLPEFRLDSLLDLRVCLQIHGCTIELLRL